MSTEIVSTNPVVASLIEGKAPRPAQVAAARGVLPLPEADLIEVLNLDAEGKNTREKVNPGLLDGIRDKILGVAEDVRANRFECGHDHSKDGRFDDLAWLLEGGSPKSGLTP